jgi:hypothetical protein
MMEVETINCNKNKSQIGDTLNLMPRALVKFKKTTSMDLPSRTTFSTKAQDKEDGPKIKEALMQKQTTCMSSTHF